MGSRPYIHDSAAQDFSFVLYTYTSTCNITMLKQGLLPCDLDLEDNNAVVSHDTPMYGYALQQVQLQKVQWIRRYCLYKYPSF